MTHSTTNTASRELIAKWRREADACPNTCGNEDRGYSNAQYQLADELEATLTQQQGGEQEAGVLSDDEAMAQAAADQVNPAWWRGNDEACAILCQKVNAILDGKDDGRGVGSDPWESTRRRLLALRSKPAASEGDGPTPQVGTARYMDGQYWFPQSAMERFGLAVADAREKRLANTSKQAVAPDYDMAAHWIDRYATGVDEYVQLDRVCEALGVPDPPVGWEPVSVVVTELDGVTDYEAATPPRHPADEGRDAELTAFVRGIYERMSRSYEINNRILYGDMQYLFDFATSRKIVLIPALQAGTPT